MFGKGWWYPGKYLQYTACVGACRVTCKHDIIEGVCNLLDGNKCRAAIWGCACDLIGVGNIALSFFKATPYGLTLGVLDCLCDLATTIQSGCRGHSTLSIGAIATSTSTSCLSALNGFLKKPPKPKVTGDWVTDLSNSIDEIARLMEDGIADTLNEILEFVGRGEIPLYSTCGRIGCECF